jgi:GNAT superfamily N-acetyltransferase
MKIRRIRADEGLRLRDIRLRALADSPGAFGETFAAAATRPEDSWHDRAARSSAGNETVLYVAEEDEQWKGLAAGWLEDDVPGDVELVSMWVDPSIRGRRIGQRLVDAVVDWALERQAIQVRLWVTEGNTPAVTLYERCGFRYSGDAQPLPSNPTLRELQMVRLLDPTACGELLAAGFLERPRVCSVP